jgi:hypothetical protein
MFFEKAIFLVLLFYLRWLVGNYKLSLTGSYSNDQQHWESGMRNFYVYRYNHYILSGIFLITRIVFCIIYIKHFRRLNPKPFKIGLNSFPGSTQER